MSNAVASIADLKRLIELRALSVHRNGVVLSSGAKSDRYVDMRRVSMHSIGCTLIGNLLWDMTKDYEIKAIGGPATAAIPLVVAAVQRYGHEVPDMEGFYTRQEDKQHGLQRIIEGYQIKPGDRVAIVEDVTSTGGSLYNSVVTASKAGAKVVLAIGIVDRQMGAKKMPWGDVEYKSIFSIDSFDWSNAHGN